MVTPQIECLLMTGTELFGNLYFESFSRDKGPSHGANFFEFSITGGFRGRFYH